MPTKFIKGSQQEIAGAIELGAGIELSQNADGLPRMDVTSSSINVKTDTIAATLNGTISFKGAQLTNPTSGEVLVDYDVRYPTLALRDQDTYSLRAGHAMTGGGTVTYNGTGVQWTNRFIVISNGRGAAFSTNGYFDIYRPADGTVIKGVGGAADVTVASAYVPLGVWQALYYILPLGLNSSSRPENFRVAYYTVDFTAPADWVLIAARNSDGTNTVRFGNGITLKSGHSWAAGEHLNVNAQLLDGQGRAFYINASNMNAGTLPDARLSGTVLRTDAGRDMADRVFIRFGHSNQLDVNDGRIASGYHGSGLNIVGTQTVVGEGRIVRVWGTLMRNDGAAYAIAGDYYDKTTSDSRFLNVAGDTMSGSLLVHVDKGTSPTFNTGHLELRSGGSNPVTLGFHRPGHSAASLVHTGNGFEVHGTSFGGFANFRAARVTGDDMHIVNRVGFGHGDPAYGLHQLGGGHRIQAVVQPPAPGVSVFGTVGTTSYTYHIMSEDRLGRRSQLSGGTTITNGNAILDGVNYNAVSWAGQAGAVNYKVFRNNELIATVAGVNGTAYNDTGAAAVAYTKPTRNDTADLIVDGQVRTNQAFAVGTVVVLDDARQLQNVGIDASGINRGTLNDARVSGNVVLFNRAGLHTERLRSHRNLGTATLTHANAQFEAHSNDGGHVGIGFHRSGHSAVNLRHSEAGVLDLYDHNSAWSRYRGGSFFAVNNNYHGGDGAYMGITNSAAAFLTSGGGALQGRFGSLMVSAAYNKAVPTSGIWSDGDIKTGGLFRVAGTILIASDNGAEIHGTVNYIVPRTNSGIQMQDRAAAIKGYVYFDANSFGLLSANGSWAVRTTDTGVELPKATSITNTLTVSSTASLNSNVHITSAGTALSFGARLGQLVNLWNASYGQGIQSNTQYFRSGSRFSWFVGGAHADVENDPGVVGTTAGAVAMTLINGLLSMKGRIDLGPNTNWGRTLRLGGDPLGAGEAQIMTTDGNIHADPNDGTHGIFLNWYRGDKVVIGNGASAQRAQFYSGGLILNEGHYRVNGTNAFYFETHGGGWFMQDTTWIRSFNSKSVWLSTGTFGTNGGISVGRGGGRDVPVDIVGHTRIAGTAANADAFNGALEIRERSLGGALLDRWEDAPRLGFHWGGRVATQIALGSNGTLYVINQGATAASSLYAFNHIAEGEFIAQGQWGAVIGGTQLANCRVRVGEIHSDCGLYGVDLRHMRLDTRTSHEIRFSQEGVVKAKINGEGLLLNELGHTYAPIVISPTQPLNAKPGTIWVETSA